MAKISTTVLVADFTPHTPKQVKLAEAVRFAIQQDKNDELVISTVTIKQQLIAEMSQLGHEGLAGVVFLSEPEDRVLAQVRSAGLNVRIVILVSGTDPAVQEAQRSHNSQRLLIPSLKFEEYSADFISFLKSRVRVLKIVAKNAKQSAAQGSTSG